MNLHISLQPLVGRHTEICIGEHAKEDAPDRAGGIPIRDLFPLNAIGRPPAEVCARAVEHAVKAGLAEALMGGSRFLGHGVGLQIDEWPVIAEGFDQPLPEGAVVAFEPKFALRGGIVGAETAFIFEGGQMQPTVTLPAGLVRLD